MEKVKITVPEESPSVAFGNRSGRPRDMGRADDGDCLSVRGWECQQQKQMWLVGPIAAQT